MSALTIEFGEGNAVVVADALSQYLSEQVLAVVRGFFESDDALAEGWVTTATPLTTGFSATHGRIDVTFSVEQ